MQFVREFAKLGLTRSVGGVLGLALSRELTPVVTSIILAGEILAMLASSAPLSLRAIQHASPKPLFSIYCMRSMRCYRKDNGLLKRHKGWHLWQSMHS